MLGTYLASPAAAPLGATRQLQSGGAQTFADTGQVLNTGGFDLALLGTNEALNWRPIGTTGITDPGGNGLVPEPGSLALLATGGLPLLGFLRRRRLSA
jgi:hypothetical protein